MQFINRHIAYLAFALLGLIWGTNFIFTKWAANLISAEQIVLLRVLFGFVPLLIVALARRALSWAHLRHAHHFLAMALMATSLYYYAYAKGASLLLSSVAGMLSGAIPLFTFACAFVFLREEPLNRRTALGVLFGFAGVLLIARPWEAAGLNIDGVLYMVAGSLCVGCSFVYAKRFLTGLAITPLALCTYQIGTALVLIALVTNFDGMARITEDTRAMLGLSLGLGLMGTGVAYILYYFIVQRLGAVKASAVTYIPPVIALLIGVFLAQEPVQAEDMIAVAAILGGVYILQTGRNRVARV
ncbi:MAG: DMT family transporter [Pseudomonas sp.]